MGAQRAHPHRGGGPHARGAQRRRGARRAALQRGGLRGKDRGAEEDVHRGRGEDEPPEGREQGAASGPPAGQVGRAEAEEGEEDRRGERGGCVGRRRRRGWKKQEKTEKVIGHYLIFLAFPLQLFLSCLICTQLWLDRISTPKCILLWLYKRR